MHCFEGKYSERITINRPFNAYAENPLLLSSYKISYISYFVRRERDLIPAIPFADHSIIRKEIYNFFKWKWYFRALFKFLKKHGGTHVFSLTIKLRGRLRRPQRTE